MYRKLIYFVLGIIY